MARAAPAVQETPVDTLPGDTLPAGLAPDSLVVPGRGDTATGDTAAGDTAKAAPEPYLPGRFGIADDGYSATVWRCDRTCLLDHSAHNLLDLLESEVPGLVPLRESFYGGPHHFVDGLVGPALTEFHVGELPLPELAAGQVDLSRIPLAWLSRVAVIRRAGELQLRVVPVRHRTPESRSRVTAGTGEPNLNLIRGVFTNGIGRHASVSTGIDLLNTGGRRAGSDRLDFWAMASWIPGDGSGGMELMWRTQNVTRAEVGAGGEETDGDDEGGVPNRFRRRDAYVQARGELGGGVKVHVSAGRSEWSERTPDEGLGGGTAADGEEDGAGPPRVEAEGATLSLQAERPWGFARAAFGTWTGGARPRLRGRLAAGVEPVEGVRVDGAARASGWRGFSTRSVRGGVRWRPDVGLGLALHASGARGTRGVPRPWLERADSVSFEEYRGGLSLDLGPYRVSGGAALQELGRQLPFSATFDRGLSPEVADPELLTLEGRLAGPILPLGRMLGADVSPFELDVAVRRNRNRGPDSLLYVPRDVVRAGIRFRDQFFQDDLGVNFRLGTRYRSGMTTVDVVSGEAARVPSRADTEVSLVLRIVGARIWYRSENLGRVLTGNLAAQELPPIRNSFGIKWSFTN